MNITFTCKHCGSGIEYHAQSSSGSDAVDTINVPCPICQKPHTLHLTTKVIEGFEKSEIHQCPECQRLDFYSQKDFNRKLGVLLFVIAAILSIWTYGISFIVLYLFDLLLFKKLGLIAICYNCQAIFRQAKNVQNIPGFDHEMNDRIVYSGHDFQGQGPKHHS